ncbi:uncharacterized protein M6B38_119175 [Iris pallida]|uniref:Uncharacterized protein n=1 Tax=Iris pallida TaxID=29817 RepID=A0AAX6HJL1_IRIPA|nr:uncharacterized protein M6B38_119175 [Iris pallida]
MPTSGSSIWRRSSAWPGFWQTFRSRQQLAGCEILLAPGISRTPGWRYQGRLGSSSGASSRRSSSRIQQSEPWRRSLRAWSRGASQLRSMRESLAVSAGLLRV